MFVGQVAFGLLGVCGITDLNVQYYTSVSWINGYFLTHDLDLYRRALLSVYRTHTAKIEATGCDFVQALYLR